MKIGIYKLLLILSVAVFLGACEEERQFDGTSQPVVRFTEESILTSSVTEGCDAISYAVEIPFVETTGTATISLSGTATLGVDFTVTGAAVASVSASAITLNLAPVEGAVVSRSAGSFSINFLEDGAIDGSKTVQMSISSVTATGLSNIKLGDWTGAFRSGSISIADKDALNFAGTYSVITETDGGDCAGETYEGSVTLTRVGTSNDYTVSDITFLVYRNCYGNGTTPVVSGVLTITNGESVSFENVPDTAYPGDDFDGEGTADACSFELVIEWSNNYGDGGVTTLRRTS